MKAKIGVASGIILGALAMAFASVPAQAKNKTVKQCETEWKAAEAAKTTGGAKRTEFIAKCRTEEAAPAPAAAAPAPAAPPPAAAAPAPAPAPTAATPAAKPAKPAKTTTAAPAPAGNAVFPTAVSSKYSKETAGRAREHTCLDQYKANKATNGNGGLKWIQKGGGYYSQCNAKLKGA